MSLSCFIERAVPEHSSGCIHPAAIASLRDLRLRGHRRSTGECAGDLTPPDDVDAEFGDERGDLVARAQHEHRRALAAVDEGLDRLASEILAVAPTRVVNPTAYVVRAIRNDLTRPEWIARAWVIAAEIHVARANRRAAG